MAWMRVEDALEGEDYYSLALTEEDGIGEIAKSLPREMSIVADKSSDSSDSPFKEMMSWFGGSEPPRAGISAKIADLSSPIVGGGVEATLRGGVEATLRGGVEATLPREGDSSRTARAEDVAEQARASYDPGDISALEVAEYADQALPEVQQYIARLTGASSASAVGKL